MIKTNELNKYFGSVQALEDVSFQVDDGASVGLLGPNGAGKTTLLRILSTYTLPSSGSVEVCGLDLTEQPMACRHQTGYLPESVPLYEGMTPSSYLRYRGRLKGIPQSERIHRENTLMDRFGLTDLASRTISTLSKGFRKRLGLADALLADPDLLLLDEPTEGLDPNQVGETRELISNLNEKTTLLLSSHLVRDINEVCERVLIMNNGKLVFDDQIPPGSQTGERCSISLEVKGRIDEIRRTLHEMGGVMDLEVNETEEGFNRIQLQARSDIRESIVDTCVQEDWAFREIYLETPSLEDLFARETNHQ